MSIAVKVKFMKGEDSDIRRFRVAEGDAASFNFIYNKVALLFPGLEKGLFSLYWKDADKDMVCCSTDDELREALSSGNGSGLRLFVSTTGGAPRKAAADKTPLMSDAPDEPSQEMAAEGMGPGTGWEMHPSHFGPEMMDSDFCQPWMMRKMMKKMMRKMQKHGGCGQEDIVQETETSGNPIDTEAQAAGEGNTGTAESPEETEVKCKNQKGPWGRWGHRRHCRRNKDGQENSSEGEGPENMGGMGPGAGWGMVQPGFSPPWMMRKMMRKMMKRMMMRQMGKQGECDQEDGDPEKETMEAEEQEVKYKNQRGPWGRWGHRRHCRRNKDGQENNSSNSSDEECPENMEGMGPGWGMRGMGPAAWWGMMQPGPCPPMMMRKMMRKMMKRMMMRQMGKQGECDQEGGDPEKETMEAEENEVKYKNQRGPWGRWGHRRHCRRNKDGQENNPSNSSDEECPENMRGMGPGWGMRGMGPGAGWGMMQPDFCPPWMMRRMMRRMMKRMMMRQMDKQGECDQEGVDPEKEETMATEEQEVKCKNQRGPWGRWGHRRHCRRNKDEQEHNSSNSSDEECPENMRGMGPGWGMRGMGPAAGWGMMQPGFGRPWMMRKMMRKMMKRMMMRQMDKQVECDQEDVDPEKEAMEPEEQDIAAQGENIGTSEKAEDKGKKAGHGFGHRHHCRRNKGENDAGFHNSSDEDCPENMMGMGPGWGMRGMGPGAGWGMRPGAGWGMGPGAGWGMGPGAARGMFGPWAGARWGRKHWQKCCKNGASDNNKEETSVMKN